MKPVLLFKRQSSAIMKSLNVLYDIAFCVTFRTHNEMFFYLIYNAYGFFSFFFFFFVFSKRSFNVRSFGTGTHVKLPGPAPDKPNVYDFKTTYEQMYNDLLKKDKELYPRGIHFV